MLSAQESTSEHAL